MSTCPRTDRLLRLLGDDLPRANRRSWSPAWTPARTAAEPSMVWRPGAASGMTCRCFATTLRRRPRSNWSKGPEAQLRTTRTFHWASWSHPMSQGTWAS